MIKKKTEKRIFCIDCFSLNKAFISAGVYLAVFLSTTLSHSSVTADSQTYYVTFNGRGSQNGLSYANSWSWNDFLSSGNWSATEDNNRIDPGDTIYLSGTFNIGTNTNAIPGSGTSGNYITIDGNDGVNPSATINPTYSSSNSSIDIESKNYLAFRDISFSGGSRRLFRLYDADYIKIYNCTMIGNYHKGIFVQAGSSYVQIYNNTITSTRVGTDADGVFIFPNAASPPISNIYVYNNTVSDWNHTGISAAQQTGQAEVSYVFIYENYITLPNRGYGRAFDSTSVDGDKVHHIYIHHNFIDSLRAPSQIAGAENVYVYNNVFYNAQNCCVSADDEGCVEAYSNCGSKKHYWFKTGQHLVLHTAHGSTDHVYIYNNTFYDSAESAIQLRDQSAVIDHVYVENNIFYNGANAASHTTSDPVGSACTSCDRTILAYGGKGITNAKFKNNIVFTSGRSNDIYLQPSVHTVSGFDSAFSWATDNLDSDPLFTNPEGKDFTLQTNSPAIDAGTNIGSNYAFGWNPDSLLPPNPLNTLNQNEFGSGWDLGAYIFSALSKPNPPPTPPANFGKKKELAVK